MSKLNGFCAALLVAALSALAPSASATTDVIRAAITGSSASWQAMALGAYNAGNCAALGGTLVVHPPCFHYTSKISFNLFDTRPSFVGGGTNNDPGGIWIVWDSPTGTQTRNVWFFLKVDSIVGDRCFFANPKCSAQVPAGYNWTTQLGNKIAFGLWGNDTVPPSDVTVKFATAGGIPINTAATDIRPEDALFETCRVNSALGNGAAGGFGDGLDGLGYNTNNTAGDCPAFGAPLNKLVGTPIASGISPATGATANPLAFNISGHDPFTNRVVAAGTVMNIGAAPIVFVFSRSSTANAGLAGATDITDAQAQNIFSGADCNASEVGAGPAPIDVYLREPLSGTMGTAELSVFRRQDKTIPPQNTYGTSQETGVNATTLSATPCTAGGGTRTRGIGTGEVVGGVKASGGAHNDGIAYTFFSFGNVSGIANSGSYGYLTLDGQDPLGVDTGANNTTNQRLPVCDATVNPCLESDYWSTNSFPSLRAGNYTAWQLLRLVTSNTGPVKALLQTSYQYVVSGTPDFIPDQKTTVGTQTDPGVTIFHSHFQQRGGDDQVLGPVATNGPAGGFVNRNPPIVATDHGGEAGGCTIATPTSTTDATWPAKKKNYIQSNVTGSGATCTLARD
jgi:hypothetical protein